jgi:hypothetical protein
LRTVYAANPALKGYNLAYGGATVDAKFVTPYLSTVQSLKGKHEALQVRDDGELKHQIFSRNRPGSAFQAVLQSIAVCSTLEGR